ncbi:MAG TPA: ABC transporter ATP-binding protein, partial [Verrucomicrobiae bacterium]|nr:ABC transporter ATP-binding protein [Verrucomicrobiae bacterium]
MSLLSVQNLSLAFGAKQVVRDLSINVAAGEIVALVGESGSGKSLTLLSVMGLLPRNATLTGRIALGDQALAGANERTLRQMRGRDIGMVFQEPATALNPVRTLLQQVMETILLHKAADIAQARVMALDALARMGIDAAQATRYPHQVSGGQRQRAAIAIATVLKPKLILADEPTTALDVTTQAQVMQLLRERVSEGAGLLLVTHDLGLVAEHADRIAILKDGEIVEQGASPALLRNLQHPYASSLLRAATLAPAPARIAGGPPLLRV